MPRHLKVTHDRSTTTLLLAIRYFNDVADLINDRLYYRLFHGVTSHLHIYFASLTWDTRVENLAAVKGATRILVRTDAAGMGVDIPDIQVIIQWKTARHLSLAGLVQRIGRAGRDDPVDAIAITMIEERYFFPKKLFRRRAFLHHYHPPSLKRPKKFESNYRRILLPSGYPATRKLLDLWLTRSKPYSRNRQDHLSTPVAVLTATETIKIPLVVSMEKDHVENRSCGTII